MLCVRRVLPTLFIGSMVVLVACTPAANAADNLTSRLRDGDIIFQISRSAQGKAIQAASGSKYTHMGIIFLEKDGTPRVFEAVQPVQITPLSKWVRRGKRGHFVIKRLKGPHAQAIAENVAALRKEATRMLGRDYDLLFDWSNDKLYCSEYVWKIYKRVLDLEVGTPQLWSELDMSSPAVRRLAKKRLGHLPSPRGRVITPVRMLESPLLVPVATGP